MAAAAPSMWLPSVAQLPLADAKVVVVGVLIYQESVRPACSAVQHGRVVVAVCAPGSDVCPRPLHQLLYYRIYG